MRPQSTFDADRLDEVGGHPLRWRSKPDLSSVYLLLLPSCEGCGDEVPRSMRSTRSHPASKRHNTRSFYHPSDFCMPCPGRSALSDRSSTLDSCTVHLPVLAPILRRRRFPLLCCKVPVQYLIAPLRLDGEGPARSLCSTILGSRLRCRRLRRCCCLLLLPGVLL